MFIMKITGEIIEGIGRATRLGFPTFNIVLPEGVIGGVYVGRVNYVGCEYRAIVFADTHRSVLESHLLEFSTNERERIIEVELVKKVRDTEIFKNDEELVERIKKDIEEVYKSVQL